jgi:RNA-dependent RNA polymerase
MRTRFNGRKPRFFHAGRPPKKATETLLKVPFVDPDVEQDRERKIIELNDNIRIQMVQIGVLYKVAHSASRAFSVEWEHDCIKKDVAWLWMHYDHKVIRIQVSCHQHACYTLR